MRSTYYLMNKDNKILEFSITETPLGESIEQTKEFSANKPIAFNDIATWIDTRNYAKHKTHFKQWLNEWGIDTAKGFIDITHCLGINDSLWIKSTDSTLHWSDINLYHNDFSDVAQKTAFETGLHGLQISSTDLISPEFTSEGTAPKCWRKEGDSIYLYKARLTGASNFGLEANAEYISSNIAQQIVGENSIRYELTMFKDNLCSKCELFTTEDEGYVPFYKFVDPNKHYTLNDVLNICKEMGYENECRQMILVDSIIFNQDRHLGNFGFIVDNDTYKIKGFAPLFDYNSSMLCNAMSKDIDSIKSFCQYENTFQLGHKLGGKFSEVGKAILTPELKNLIPTNITFPQNDRYNMEDDRVKNIIKVMENNLALITDKIYYTVNYENIDINRDDHPVIVHQGSAISVETATEMKERVESIKQDVADTIQNHKRSIDQSIEVQKQTKSPKMSI